MHTSYSATPPPPENFVSCFAKYLLILKQQKERWGWKRRRRNVAALTQSLYRCLHTPVMYNAILHVKRTFPYSGNIKF